MCVMLLVYRRGGQLSKGQQVPMVVWLADGGPAGVCAASPGYPHWAPEEGALGNGTALGLGAPQGVLPRPGPGLNSTLYFSSALYKPAVESPVCGGR